MSHSTFSVARQRAIDGADAETSIHGLGLVGHIEDIVVNKDQQGKKLGLRIIEALDYIAEKVGCYKVRTTGCSSMWFQHVREGLHPIFLSQVADGTILSTDYPRLFRDQRGVLRKVWIQASWAGDGTLL